MKYAYNFHEVLDKMGFERGVFFLFTISRFRSGISSIFYSVENLFQYVIVASKNYNYTQEIGITVIVILLHFFWPIGIYHPLGHARKGILSSTTIKVFHYSTAGKKIIIKTVAQAVLMYTISVVKLPNTLCDEMTNMVHKFWWGQMNERNKMA